MLTKSDYLRYLQCHLYCWLYKHKKALIPPPSEPTKFIFEQGDLIESYARKLFPSGKLVKGFYNKAQEQTEQLIESGSKTIFQATAMTNDLMAMADVFKYDDKNKCWNIYEVKSGTSADIKYIHDICFQRITFQEAGYQIGKVFLIHVDKSFTSNGEIDPHELLITEDVTAQVNEIESEVGANIKNALKLIALPKQPTHRESDCPCSYSSCPLPEHCFPNVPEYSVYHLFQKGEKLNKLIDQNVIKVADVPDDFELTDIQEKYVSVAKTGEPKIQVEEIKERLNQLEYPLYFLDYETFNPAIPPFDKYHPYQQIPFQYSLHIIKSPSSEAKHYEYLHDRLDDPVPQLLKNLSQQIGTKGSVISWNKGFEMDRNNEMRTLYPKHKAFLKSVNDRMFDLMEIFSQRLYMHPDFKGSASIKNVLPVLAPGLTYKGMKIAEGTMASYSWYRTVTEANMDHEEKDLIREDLLKYCGQDTWAMVKIWKKLINTK